MVVFLMALGLSAAGAGPAAAEDDVIRLGAPTTLSIFQGDEMLKAATMAVEEINAGGGVQVGDRTMQIELISADLRDALPGVPVPEALVGLEKMILDDDVHALVIGPVRSEALLPAMDVVAKHRVPMIGTVAMTPASGAKIKNDPEKYKYIFRAGLNARQLVGYLVGSMKHLEERFGFNRMFIMIQDVMWARGGAKAVAGALENSGWKILGTEAYPTGASDFSAGLLKAKAGGAQVILVLFDMPQSGVLVKQWSGMKVPALLAGNLSPMSGPDAWETYDRKIAGVLNTIMEAGNIPIPAIVDSVRFYEAFQERWGQAIQAPHGPSASYEAVYIMADAIERAGSLDPDRIVEEIQKTDRQGVMGRVRFDQENQVVFGQDPDQAALACVFQWRDDGGREVVYPETVAQEPVLLPGWMNQGE
jgi:branched-chain amino acid transport system substrate-binding protein